jgi:hypothetical protein
MERGVGLEGGDELIFGLSQQRGWLLGEDMGEAGDDEGRRQNDTMDLNMMNFLGLGVRSSRARAGLGNGVGWPRHRR